MRRRSFGAFKNEQNVVSAPRVQWHREELYRRLQCAIYTETRAVKKSRKASGRRWYFYCSWRLSSNLTYRYRDKEQGERKMKKKKSLGGYWSVWKEAGTFCGCFMARVRRGYRPSMGNLEPLLRNLDWSFKYWRHSLTHQIWGLWSFCGPRNTQPPFLLQHFSPLQFRFLIISSISLWVVSPKSLVHCWNPSP